MGGAGAAQPGSTNRPGDAQAKVRRGFRSRLTAFQFFAIVGAAWVAYLLAMMAWGGLNLLLLLAAAVVGGGALFAAYRLDLRHRVNPDQVATAEVLTVSNPPPKSIIGRCVMTLRVTLNGRAPIDVQFRDRWMPVARWPSVGQLLPVEVWFSNPRRLRIRWDLLDLGFPRPPTPTPSRSSRPSSPHSDSNGATPPPWAPSGPGPRLPTSFAGPSPAHDRPSGARRRRNEEPIEADVIEESLRIPFQRPSTDLSFVRNPSSDQLRAEDPAGVSDAVRAAGPVAGMLLVSDLDRSVRFYTEKLAFTVVYVQPGSAVLEYRRARILLQGTADFPVVTNRAMFLLIAVPDIWSAHTDLESNGIEFRHRPTVVSRGDNEETWLAAFLDPDGHGVALAEWRHRHI